MYVHIDIYMFIYVWCFRARSSILRRAMWTMTQGTEAKFEIESQWGWKADICGRTEDLGKRNRWDLSMECENHRDYAMYILKIGWNYGLGRLAWFWITDGILALFPITWYIPSRIIGKIGSWRPSAMANCNMRRHNRKASAYQQSRRLWGISMCLW